MKDRLDEATEANRAVVSALMTRIGQDYERRNVHMVAEMALILDDRDAEHTKERDQLRANLAAGKQHHEIALGEIQRQRKLVEEARDQRDAAQRFAANLQEALTNSNNMCAHLNGELAAAQRRLGEAMSLLTDIANGKVGHGAALVFVTSPPFPGMGGEVPGSSTGEAVSGTKSCQRPGCGHAEAHHPAGGKTAWGCIVAKCSCQSFLQPAAPEPAPAKQCCSFHRSGGKASLWCGDEPITPEPAPASAMDTLLRSQKPMDADVRAAVYENLAALYIDASAPASAQALLRDYVAPEAGLAHWEWLARRAALLIRTPAPASAQGTTEPKCTCGSGGHPRRCVLHPWAYRQHIADLEHLALRDDVDALAKLVAALREEFEKHTHWTPEEMAMAKQLAEGYRDIFPDDAQPRPAPVERTAENAPRCCDTDCRHYGQRHWTPHEVREEPAPVGGHAFVSNAFGDGEHCYYPVSDDRLCGQPRSASVHGEGGK